MCQVSLVVKYVILAHVIKINSRDFQHQISLYIIYSKTKLQFSMNCQNIACNILSQLGLTNQLAYFLVGLTS